MLKLQAGRGRDLTKEIKGMLRHLEEQKVILQKTEEVAVRRKENPLYFLMKRQFSTFGVV